MMNTRKIYWLTSSSILYSNELIKYRREGDKGYWKRDPFGRGGNNGSFVVVLVKLSDSINNKGN